HRVYVSGQLSDGNAVLLVSNDDAQHWAAHTFPIDPAREIGAFIAAVDPQNADRVYVRVARAFDTRLVVTDDGGGSFRDVRTTLGRMLGFALSPDGSKVYFGGPRDGLMLASRSDLAFVQRSTLDVECLATSGTTLYACSTEPSGFLVGSSDDDGATFAP